MRDIKFRARHVKTGEWLYGSLHPDKRLGSQIDLSIFWMYIATGVLIPDTVGQYIGRNDKNNKEMCEGDKVILKGKYGWDKSEVVRYAEIEASDDMTAPGVGYQFGYIPEQLEIIGTIHDNLELLEKHG